MSSGMALSGKWRQILQKSRTNRNGGATRRSAQSTSNLRCRSRDTRHGRNRCARGVEPNSAQDQVFQRGYEIGRVAQRGHHAKCFDTELLGFLASLDIDSVEGLNVFGDERNGHHQYFLHTFVGKALNGGRQWRLEPLGWANAALIAEDVRTRPVWKLLGTSFTGQTHGCFYLARVGIALFDQAHRQSVSAENQVNPRAVRKLPQHTTDVFNQTEDIQRMIVETFDHSFGWSAAGSRPLRAIRNAVPFFHAAERGGVGIVRVKRQQHNFVEWSGVAQCVEGFDAHGMPV